MKLIFRGFYKEKPVIFDFNSLHGNRCGVPCVDIDGAPVSINLLENIGLFTGLKDKNKKEIYEGDILIYKLNYIEYKEEVSFFNFGFLMRNKNLSSIPLSEYIGTISEVIGNIYYNPELIK